ncbi:MAG: hypothetical protein JNJ54_22205 [Myxococcaceae bacterium]|nr:hypothetical protein [Myxococcaceae bacterium]
MFDSVTHLHARRFHLESSDPSFHVERRGSAKFLLSGTVSEEPTTALGVQTPSESFELTLATQSRPEHAVATLRRELPRDVVMQTLERIGGIEVSLTEALVPAARPPRFRVLSTDLQQRLTQLDDNRIEVRGALGGDALLTILCDSRRVTISVAQGLSAAATAIRIAASVPHGYRALADGAIVSVWKDADFFSAVA